MIMTELAGILPDMGAVLKKKKKIKKCVLKIPHPPETPIAPNALLFQLLKLKENLSSDYLRES